ncbi:MAG: flagellar assembly protein FliX [Proteobacteria bacterium]|nr:flagellar assembly protein FliX [Pseudomonadota bacterium]
MKIDPTRRTGASNVKRSGSSAKGASGDFARLLQASSETEATSGPAAAAPVDSLLALQEVSDQGGGGKNSARHRAELMLDRLEEIRTGLLLGSIPRSQLHELAQVAQQTRESFVDPALSDVLDDIELRARVELAKLDATEH